MDLALNNPQRLICHKNSTNQPINGTLTTTTFPGQSETRSYGNEVELHTPFRVLEQEPNPSDRF